MKMLSVIRRRIQWTWSRVHSRCFASSSSSSGLTNPSSCPEWTDSFTFLIQGHEHRERQTRLVTQVTHFLKTQDNKKSLVVIPASKRVFQADTVIPELTMKQNSNFVYLTGLNFLEAGNSVLILVIDEECKFKSLLFIPFMTETEITWEGHGLRSPEFTKRLEAVCDSLENVKYVESFISEESSLRHVFTTKQGLSLEDRNGVRRLKPIEDGSGNIVKKPVFDINKLLDQQRVLKSPNEVMCMKRTCSIGSQALSCTRDFSRDVTRDNINNLNISLINESQVAAKFDFESRVKGANKLAYPSVVAGGPRATFIHYGSCNKFMKEEDWILMDAGCEDIEGYCSDITRCWMISGSETVSSSQSRLQAALYEALCEVQLHLTNHLKSMLPNQSPSLSSLGDIEDVSPSSTQSVSLDQLFQVMCILLGKVLIEFCVIPKSSSTSESAKAAYKFCPHHVSHFLGLDVHDTPSVPRSTPLKPGMCFTLEPGLYFRETDDIKKEFKGIGLRVEDDLIIDPLSGQLQVLTKDCSW